jgi:SAM-dependent methyltransferase
MSHTRDYAATERFSDRVSDYERYRPGYPTELIDWIMQSAELRIGDTVADIGAGTGLFTRDLVAAGLKVLAVEPNAPMRGVAERQLGAIAGFVGVDGSAERTALANGSVRLVTAAQAFHWFDPVSTRVEFKRILEPGCGVALIWNVRRMSSAFAVAYEQLLLRRCADYADGVPAQADPKAVAEFFAPAECRSACFDYTQHLDYAGLCGRLLSSSYTPKEADPARTRLLADLQGLFDQYAQAGTVCFEYDTRVFFGLI